MSKDQAHEQNNSILKGSGGIIGIPRKPRGTKALDGCWARSGALLNEF